MRNWIFILAVMVTVFTACDRKAEERDWKRVSWEEILKEGRETEVTFAMWGGSTEINTWVDDYVAGELKELYGITLKRAPIDAVVMINRLLGEKQAERKRGTIDLLWINGENFRNAKNANLLWGPYTEALPNYGAFVDPDTAATDFGQPVEGYEAPYGKAWYVFEHDPERTGPPPADLDELAAWIKRHPGRFTYPQPPDFTGSAFLRLVLYHVSGGVEPYLPGWDEERAEQGIAAALDWLEDLEPHLWQAGRSYPRDSEILYTLFERGEVDFAMSYNVSHASLKIAAGGYPESVRTFVPERLALFNLHFTAIPFNAPNKPGAMVVSNFLLSPEAQLSKNKPANWGDLTVLDLSRLSAEQGAAFEALDMGSATLNIGILSAQAVPEISPSYVEALEKAWNERFLNQ